jgi:hypothetical protein
MFRARMYKAKIVVAISALLVFQGAGYSQSESPAQRLSSVRTEFRLAAEDNDRCSESNEARLNAACTDGIVSTELLVLGQRGDQIARARQEALEILQAQNGCASWFQESDPDAVEVFRSLHYEVDRQGNSHIDRVRGEFGITHFKHPWAAMSNESTGRNSSIALNVHGPFFVRQSRVIDSAGTIRPTWHWLNVGFYEGDTTEARVTILLHELGHIIGRLPADNDSWDGQSSRNTMEVLRHCKREIDRTGRKGSRISN